MEFKQNITFNNNDINLHSFLNFLSVMGEVNIKNIYITKKYIDLLVKSLKTRDGKITNNTHTVISYLNKKTGNAYVIMLKIINDDIYRLIGIKTTDLYYNKLNYEDRLEANNTENAYLLSHIKEKNININKR